MRGILGDQERTLDTRLNNVDTKLSKAAREQTDTLWSVTERLRMTLTEGLDKARRESEEKLGAMRVAVTEGLEKVRQDNETKLEQMRQTVDE